MNLRVNLVIRFLFIVFFLSTCFRVFSQNLEGTYLDALPGSSSVTSITFEKSGSFKYSTSSDTGNIDYGRGSFILTSNKLSLFFSNDLPLKEYGNHHVQYWKSLNDSIKINFELSKENMSPINKTHIVIFLDTMLMGGVSILEGENKVQMKLPKRSDNKFYTAIINRIGYDPFVLNFNNNFNQNIRFNIIKTNYEIGVPILNEVIVFKVLEISKNIIKVQNEIGKIINWSKID